MHNEIDLAITFDDADYEAVARQLEQEREKLAGKFGDKSIKLGMVLFNLHECYLKLGETDRAKSVWRNVGNLLRHTAEQIKSDEDF